VQEILSD